jgi:hypothetical protein
MAKRIVVLDRNPDTGVFRVLYWVAPPVARQAKWLERQGNPTESKWEGATAGENSDIASGAIVEFEETYSKQGTDLPSAQADLEARWGVLNSWIATYNPWNRYGSYWDDSTGWTTDGVS